MKSLTLLSALLVASSSSFSYESGNELLADLESSSWSDRTVAISFVKGTTNAFRDGFIVGFKSAERRLNQGNKAPDHQINPGFCIPANATVGQLADVAVKYLKANPQERHERPVPLTIFAMREAFPCSNK